MPPVLASAMPLPESARLEASEINAWRSLALVAGAQAVCWFIAPLISSDAPPLDVVELSIWGTEHVIATYKNPALSSLLLEASRLATGSIGWPAYILSQIAVVVTFICVFLLGREPLGEKRALAGTLLLTACYYFGWHTPEFNHDIISMPFWAATSLALWRAAETGRPMWWIILGLVAAGSVYCKLSAAVLLAAAGTWMLIDARARSRFATPGPWLALVVFAVVVAPLAYWLAGGGLQMIAEYAVARGQKHAANAFKWIAIQAAMPIPMILIAWGLGLLPIQKSSAADVSRNVTTLFSANGDRFTRFLLWMTAVPILLTAIIAILGNAGAKLMWGVPMLSLTGLLIMSQSPAAVSAAAVRRLSTTALAIIVGLSSAFAVATYFKPQFASSIVRPNWPQAAIGKRMREIWQAETGGLPLRIVAGDTMNWVSGLVIISQPVRPSLLTGGSYTRSPWVTPERVAAEGALVVWPDSESVLTGELETLMGLRTRRYIEIPLPRPGRAKSVRIGYVVVPPQQ